MATPVQENIKKVNFDELLKVNISDMALQNKIRGGLNKFDQRGWEQKRDISAKL
jgi:hypothetical protein